MTVFDARAIQEIIPHRYPFLLVDRIIELVPGTRIVGIKQVTINEPFFQGHYPGNPVMPGVLQIEAMAQAAGILMLRKISSEGKTALFMSCDKVKFRRAVRPGDPWSGQVALPGGRREPRDRDLLATAIRETREETGVDLRRGEPLAVLDDLAPLTRVLPPVVVRPFVFALSRRPALRPNDEVQHAFWVPLDRFAEPGLRREVTLNVRGEERTLPAYVVGEDVIWGMTERILTPFLELVGTSG